MRKIPSALHSRPEGHTSRSKEKIPFDSLKLQLGGPPSQGVALLNAARLGLELENDIRVSSERLSQLRHPRIPIRFQPPPIRETIPLVDEVVNEPPSPDPYDNKVMPLL
jgi:hypothetical protein